MRIDRDGRARESRGIGRAAGYARRAPERSGIEEQCPPRRLSALVPRSAAGPARPAGTAAAQSAVALEARARTAHGGAFARRADLHRPARDLDPLHGPGRLQGLVLGAQLDEPEPAPPRVLRAP